MRTVLSFTLCLTVLIGFSQKNLVPNPYFEQVEEKKLKGKGQITYATPWISPTLAPADLYVPKTKDFAISVPENAYGEEKPMKGTGYAGIMAYSYKNKVPRSYLQVKLKEQLDEGREYCVTFHVSLADLSKFACNHLGVALTATPVTANNSDVLEFDSFIESRRLTIYEQQYYWIPVCGIYKSKGAEEYLTIGNFTDDEKVQTKKVKRPRGFTKPQTYDAYYYIDNVSVTPIEETKKCDCDAIPGMEDAELVKSSFNSDKTVNTKTVKIINTDGSENTGSQDKTKSSTSENTNIDGMVIGFDPKLYALKKEAIQKLDKVIQYMKTNPKSKIRITGFIDKSETGVEKLDGRRVGAPYKYIVSKGVAKERIERKLGGDTAVDPKQKTKNMRAEITLITK